MTHYFNRYSTIEDMERINTWKEYSEQSHDNKRVHKQFDNLLGFNATTVLHKKYKQCPHHHGQFANQAAFLQLIDGYINDKAVAVRQLAKHDSPFLNKLNIDPVKAIKAGICGDCICNFIIKTKGLNSIHMQWTKNVKNIYFKLYRKEFMNTNIIVCNQPLFLKAILMKSNIKCLEKIFRLFFIVYLKNTNLNELIMQNAYNTKGINRRFSLWNVPLSVDKFVICNENINICHGFEHSLCSLSTTIIMLLPLLKLYHIKYLFIDHEELKEVPIIIDNFLKQYCKLPHIVDKVQEFNRKFTFNDREKKQYQKWRKKIKKDKTFLAFWPYKDDKGAPVWIGEGRDVSFEQLYDQMVITKHPILQRFMFILSSLYQHFRRSRSLKQKANSDPALIKQLKSQQMRFECFMYKNKMEYARNLSYLTNEYRYSSHIVWSLVPLYRKCRKSNKDTKIEYHQHMCCATCNVKQSELFKHKLKTCGGCKFVYYCSKKCQKHDWSRNNHRNMCGALKNALCGND